MPHRIFLVEDLVILITKELVQCSHSEWDAVSLALTCRALESPALSVLWARQTMLSTLIRVLPPNTLAYTTRDRYEGLAGVFLREEIDIVKDPLNDNWDRLKRYGSWMRVLCLSESNPDGKFIPGGGSRELIIGKNVFNQLSLAFPTDLVCPGLQKLKWHSSHRWLPSLRHFLSPTLAEITIFTIPLGGLFRTPLLAIPVLPGSYLRSLRLTFHPADDEAFGNSASIAILQCGVFLERLETSAQLSRAAALHLLGLRHLRTLRIGSDPPSDTVIPSYPIFPSLETLVLDNGVGHKWLFFLVAAQDNSTDGESRISEAGMITALTKLCCQGGITVDPTFISSLCIFRRLTHVFVESSCSRGGGCTFLLTDDDVTKLADALPNIKSLRLGSPCIANRCQTTVFSLFTLSTRCLKLRSLEIHFNTTNIGYVLGQLFKAPQYQAMRSLPRCPLRYLAVANTPISSRDIPAVVIYLSGIFHGLQGFRGRHRKWIEASREVRLLYNLRSHIAPDTCIDPDSEGGDDSYDVDDWSHEDDLFYDSRPRWVPSVLDLVRSGGRSGSEW